MNSERREDLRIERLQARFSWGVSSDGKQSGHARGLRLGSSGEFEGYRAYAPGDDLRRLDLKIRQRLGKHVIRVTQEDSCVPVTVLVDRSASMLGSEVSSKDRTREKTIEDLLIFFVLMTRRLGDPMRIASFHDGMLDRWSPLAYDSPGAIRHALNAHPPVGSSDYHTSFSKLTPHPAGKIEGPERKKMISKKKRRGQIRLLVIRRP